jgi:hypothetical protein
MACEVSVDEGVHSRLGSLDWPALALAGLGDARRREDESFESCLVGPECPNLGKDLFSDERIGVLVSYILKSLALPPMHVLGTIWHSTHSLTPAMDLGAADIATNRAFCCNAGCSTL